MVCSKCIEPLVGRNTFIDLEVQNPNPLQSSLHGYTHTSPSASTIVGNTSGTVISQAIAFRMMYSLDSNQVPFSGNFSLGNSQKSHGAMSGVCTVQHDLCDFQMALLLLHC
jgi:hypothetical protein